MLAPVGIGADDAPATPIVVDAVRHRWVLRTPELEHDADHGAGNHEGARAAPVLQLRIKLMNVTQDPAGGVVVVRVALIADGLEQDYLEAAIRRFGAQALQETLTERGDQSPRGRAILSYLERGRNLPQGQVYEPVAGAGERHLLWVRVPVRLWAGDTIEHYYERAVPDDHGGYRVEVDVAALEVGA